MAEAGNGHAARAALIDERGHRRAHPHHVGRETELAGDVLVDMRVGIDQPWGDDEAGGVDDLARATGFKRGNDGSDPTLANADVADAVGPIGGIDDPPALQHQVIAWPKLGDRCFRCLARPRHRRIPPAILCSPIMHKTRGAAKPDAVSIGELAYRA